MNQTNIIVGAIMVGFFVFVTVKGELPDYLAIYTTPDQDTEPDDNGASTASDALNLAKAALTLITDGGG